MFIMRVLPRTIDKQIAFFETRLPEWALEPATLGLSAATVEQLEALTSEARAAYQAAVAARNAAQAATLTLRNALERLRKPGAAAVATIKAKASTMDDPSIYSKASLPTPGASSPTPAPAAPQTPTAHIGPTGRVRLAWVGRGPTGTPAGAGSRGGAGTSFLIYRQDPGLAGPRLIGVTSELSFEDETAPLIPGAPLLYTLQARRAGKLSPMTTPIAIDLPVHSAIAAPHSGRRAA